MRRTQPVGFDTCCDVFGSSKHENLADETGQNSRLDSVDCEDAGRLDGRLVTEAADNIVDILFGVCDLALHSGFSCL